jgi:hypothetical protein
MGHSDEQYYRFAMLCDTVNHIIIASIWVHGPTWEIVLGLVLL